MDEKEKLTFKIRQANDDAQTSFAVGMVLTNNFKKDYAQVRTFRKPQIKNSFNFKNMVDLQKVNNKIEELFKSIETMSNPLTQRDHAEMSSVENSLNAAEDFIRFEQKKHNHDEVNTIKIYSI